MYEGPATDDVLEVVRVDFELMNRNGEVVHYDEFLGRYAQLSMPTENGSRAFAVGLSNNVCH